MDAELDELDQVEDEVLPSVVESHAEEPPHVDSVLVDEEHLVDSVHVVEGQHVDSVQVDEEQLVVPLAVGSLIVPALDDHYSLRLVVVVVCGWPVEEHLVEV